MKKVIRLTERQLENIIHRVISEQTKDDDGGDDFQINYKLSQITDNDSLDKFVNFSEGSYANATNTLKNLGLKKGSQQMGGKDATDNLITFFNYGLVAVAKTGVVNPQQMNGNTFVRALDSQLATTRFKTSDVLKFYPNYYEVLSKLAEIQIEKLG
jgi:hypothetical protein